jgi:hypothetical protein
LSLLNIDPIPYIVLIYTIKHTLFMRDSIANFVGACPYLFLPTFVK